MRAWLLDELQGVEKLRLATAPDPSPGPGEVVLDVEYSALNPADRYLAMGQYPATPPLPHILGRDGVGPVKLIGDGVSGISVGQRLVVLRGETGVYRAGTFAEQVAVKVDSLVSVPQGWTIQEACAAPLVYLTAWQALTLWDDLPADAVVLVTGASGGVGVAALQLARAMGYRVIGLSRQPAKQARLRELGAELAISPDDPHWRQTVRTAMNDRRVDLAIDNIGGALFSQVIDTLADRGRVSVVGRLAGAVPQFNTASLIFRRIRIGGVAVGAYKPAESQEIWRKIVELLSEKRFKPLVDSVWPFEELPKAFQRLESGPMGKVVLAVAGR